jgi:hypothetical protein
LPSAFSEFILIVVIVEGLFLYQIQLDRIQTYDFELNSTLFTIYRLAFIHIEIDVDVSITFRTRSGRHFIYLQEIFDYWRVAAAPFELRSLRTPSSI